MREGLADLEAVIMRARAAWRPPPDLTASQWADRYYQLSPESSAVPGQWTTLPYQREPLDAMGGSDPDVTHVVVQKSARVGYTRMLLAVLGFHMHQDPATCLVIQPTLDDARGFSKDDLQPMIRDCPALTKVVHEDGGKDDAGNTMLSMRYAGGMVSLIGANSGTGLRRISRRIIAADEVDAYPVLIGEGDVIKLAQKRSEYYHNRRFIAGSTPLIAGVSRVEQMFEEGDKRYYFVPCPSCQHMAPLVFSGDKGHAMTWSDGKPESAFFTCQRNGCVIEHSSKRWMVERGEWRATKVGLPGHRSYHMWSALSYSPGAAWGDIAREFVEAKGNIERLRVFVNTTLGESWKERGEAPDWERLYERRERYEIGTCPPGVLFLTAGVDVQKDRLVYEVVGWGHGKQSWSIEADVLIGDTSSEPVWQQLDELLSKTWPSAIGELGIRCLAVDSGFNTNTVYNWARRHAGTNRVIATKGLRQARTIIGVPSAVDVTVNGKKLSRAGKVWIVGVDVAKAELYGWLRQQPPTLESGLPHPSGYCHIPEYGEDFFKQITGEHLVTQTDRKGYAVSEWQLIPGRENHYLDCRVYARAAATRLGLDRMRQTSAAPATAPTVRVPARRSPVTAPPTVSPPSRTKGNWLQTGSDSRFSSGRANSWLRKK